jgi:UPF0716 protein FxsA
MRAALLALFLAVPLLELAILIRIGQGIGLWPTIGLVVVTAIAGSAVLHAQGVATLARASEQMARGLPPIGPLAEGVVLIIAGALLLTPGLLTDLIGAALLVPPIRRWVARNALAAVLRSGHVHMEGVVVEEVRRGEATHRPEGRGAGPVIDGEYERVDERPDPDRPTGASRSDGRNRDARGGRGERGD